MHKLRTLIYSLGLRPSKSSIFYDRKLESEEQWRTGR